MKISIVVAMIMTTLLFNACNGLEAPKPASDNLIYGSKNFIFTKDYTYKKMYSRPQTGGHHIKPSTSANALAGLAIAATGAIITNSIDNKISYFQEEWEITNDKNQKFYLLTECEEQKDCLEQMKEYVEDHI